MPKGTPSPTHSTRATDVPGSPSRRLGEAADTGRKSVELVQRARMMLDVAAADLEAAEAFHGPFHPTAWFFRNALKEVRTAWERLRAEVGTKQLEAALKEAPIAVLTLNPSSGDESPLPSSTIVLILIGGQTYRVQRVPGTDLAPVQWRLTRLHPPHEDGPYFACRLDDGSTQCDCADWIYQDAPTGRPSPCKHLKALAALGWI